MLIIYTCIHSVCTKLLLHTYSYAMHKHTYKRLCTYICNYACVLSQLVLLSLQILQAAGVLQGADMTPEAALTKLSYLLGRKDYSMKQKKEVFY